MTRQPTAPDRDPVSILPVSEGLGLRHLMVAVGLCAVAFAAAMPRLDATAYLAIVLAPFLVLAPFVLLLRLWRPRQETLAWVLALASRRGMPLGPGLEAFADLCRGGYRFKVRRLAKLVEGGMSLPDALDRVPGLVWAEARMAVRVGWETGRLAEALDDLLAARAARRPIAEGLAWRAAYLLVVLGATPLAAVYFTQWVIPVLMQLYDAYRLPLPGVTRWFIRAFRRWDIAESGALLVVSILAGVGFIAMARVLAYLPTINRLWRPRHVAALLRSLATVMESRLPLADGLKSLAASDPHGWARRRLRRITGRVEAGGDWAEALRASGLVGRDGLAVLQSAARVGNVPWALRELAARAERRLDDRLRLLLQAGHVLAVIAVGGVVALVAVGYIAPLAALIEGMAR
ncbi:MAG TPA: type II secretion system F family protein [Isosphaeraceae bacterium]|jgi:protein transport protein HofC|nr:type II secretion system F family protein [Isosphaeraceae bacterium]